MNFLFHYQKTFLQKLLQKGVLSSKSMVKRLFKIILVLFSWDERLPNIKGTELCGVSLTANPKGATDLVKTQKQT